MRSFAILAAAAAAPALVSYVSAYPVHISDVIARAATAQAHVAQHANAPHPVVPGQPAQVGKQVAHPVAHPQDLNAEHAQQLGHEATEHPAVYPNHSVEQHAATAVAHPNQHTGEHAATHPHLHTGEHLHEGEHAAHAGKHPRRKGGRKHHPQTGQGRYANRQGVHPQTQQGEHAAHRGESASHEDQHAPATHAQPETHQHAARGRIEKASGILNHVTNVAYAVQGVHDAWQDLKQHHKRSPMPMPKGERARKAGKAVGLVADIANAASSVQGAWQSVHNRREDAYESLYEREFEFDELE
ncbi:hypothetical protein C8Q72DRAFT_527725 [Fomitopsis betulina]|nr:hypothetical protein C8Q72DRAFT_527725 [Fomitopsis betulina]